jgi:hypothetical protein
MTRKDYILIAEHLKRNTPLLSVTGKAGYNAAVEAVADGFAADNPRFDRARFLAAAGVTA